MEEDFSFMDYLGENDTPTDFGIPEIPALGMREVSRELDRSFPTFIQSQTPEALMDQELQMFEQSQTAQDILKAQKESKFKMRCQAFDTMRDFIQARFTRGVVTPTREQILSSLPPIYRDQESLAGVAFLTLMLDGYFVPGSMIQNIMMVYHHPDRYDAQARSILKASFPEEYERAMKNFETIVRMSNTC